MVEYRCPVLRGMVGPRSDCWPAVGEDSSVGLVSSSCLTELPASFSAAVFLDFLSRCPTFPSFGLFRSFLLDTI